MYLLIHTPTHMGRPVPVGYVPITQWSYPLFQKYISDTNENREAGGSITHLSKRDIERWGFMPPCGARFQVMEVELPECRQCQKLAEEAELEAKAKEMK